MKKLYPVIFLLGCLMCWNVSFGQDCPVIFNPATTQLTCDTTSIELTIDNFDPNRDDYIWHIPNPSDSTQYGVYQGSTITASYSGWYTVGLNNPYCYSRIYISKNTTPPSVSVSPSSDTICSGNSVTLTATGADKYKWQSGSLTDTFTVTPESTTSYTVIGTNTANGCTSTASDTVYVDTLPATTILASSSAVCSGDSVTLMATGALFYEWQDNFSNDSTRSFIPLSSAKYIVTGYSYNECHTADTFNLVVNPLPDASISIINQSSCQYNTVNPPQVIFTGTNGNRPYTFAYTINGIPAQAVTKDENDTVIINVPTDGSLLYYTYYDLTSVSDSNGCTRAIQGPQAEVISYILPTPLLTSTKDTAICSGTHFTYTATSSTPGLNVFYWTRPDVAGISASGPGNSGGANPAISDTLINTTSQPKTVNYIFTLSTDFCSTTATVQVTVNPTPATSISALPDSLCRGDSAVLTASGANTYQWLNSPSTSPSLPVTPQFTTSYKVVGFNEYNCFDTSTYPLVVKLLPVVKILPFPDTVCSGSSATLVATGADTYHWQSGSPKDTIIVAPDTTTSYTVTGTDTATGCTSLSLPYRLTVRPLPNASINAISSTGCQYSTTDRPQITFTGSVGKPPYLFGYTDHDGGNELFIKTNAGSSTAMLFVPTGDSGSFTYRLISVSDSNGCVREIDNQQALITVFPSPTLTSPKNPASICSGSPFTYDAESSVNTTAFSWKRLVKDGLSATGPDTGSTANIKDTLTNNKSLPDTVSYIFKLSIADGNCPKTDTVKVVVNPLPSLIRVNDTIACSGSPFAYTARSVLGTSFSWIRLPDTSVSTDAQAYGFDSTITATFTNHTLQPDTVSYIFTLTLGGGCSKIETVHFIVNPTDSIYNKPPKDTPVCSGSLFTYTAKSLLQEQGTTFSWSRDYVAGISNTDISNVEGDSIGETLINTTFAPVRVTYTYTLTTPTNCITTDLVTVMVNPTDSLTSSKDTSVCSTEPFHYQATSKLNDDTAFSWTREEKEGISNRARINVPGKEIYDTLINLTTDTIRVTYIFSLITKNVCTRTDSIHVAVKPAPVISNISDTAFCNGTFASKGIQFNDTSSRDIITWTATGDMVGLGTSGKGKILPFLATNTDTLPHNTKVNVSVTGATGCKSANFPFTVTVNPTPRITRILPKSVFCNGDSVVNGIRFHSPSHNANITWQTNTSTNIGLTAISGSDSISPFVARNTGNATTNADVAVHITDTVTRCMGDTIFTIIVNPTPLISNQLTNTVCSGSLFTDTVGSSVSGTDYTWTRQAVTGILNTDSVNVKDSVIKESLTLADTILRPVAVTYDFRLTTGSKCITDTAVVVTVNPSPRINHISDAKFCNGEVARSGISFISPTPNSSFTWSSDKKFGLGDTTGKGSIPEFTANNPDDTALIAKVRVTVTDNNNTCQADSTFAIIVNPTPTINKPADTAFCSKFFVSNGINFRSSIPNSFFTWKSSTDVGFGDTLGRRQNGIDTFTTKQTSVPLAAVVTVRVDSSNNGCPSAESSFVITIYPTPNKPTFTSLSGMTSNADTLSLCKASENINFSVIDPQDNSTGIFYHWTSNVDSPKVDIRSKDYPNTVITFNDADTATIIATAQYQNSTCVSSESQVVVVKDQTINISKQKIFPKQPGNLLIYPDNSLPGSTDSTSGYQWGYDKVLSPNSLNIIESTAVPGQVYQFYIPDPASCGCIKDGSLDTTNFYYWVLLKDGKSCATKVYYNGPFDDKPDSVRLPNPVITIQLQVIPNPNRGVFDISLKGNMYGNIEAQVYNSAGQLVFRKKFVKTTPDATEKFITGGLPAGVYFLMLRSSDLKQVRSRFIISH